LLDGLQASILEGDDKDLAEALGAATVNARKRIIDNVKQRILGSYDDNPIVFRAPLMIPEHQCYDEKNYRVWWTHSDKPFKIECLLLWGITLQTRIVFLYVGNDKAIPINAEPVSGMLYYTRLPPEELRDVIVNDQFAPRLEQKFDVQTLSPALRLRIAIEGPVSHIAFVGLTMR
jgi:hypothetical protein